MLPLTNPKHFPQPSASLPTRSGLKLDWSEEQEDLEDTLLLEEDL